MSIEAASPYSPAAATAPATSSNDASIITSDFETFLHLLTTQLENQDPLNPMDSTDFATQLATFSGVEQQVRTNTILGELQTNLSLFGMGQLAGWIGMDARAQVPVEFSGQPVTLAADPPDRADRMQMVVTNASGIEVQRIEVPVTDEALVWTGLGNDGTPLPTGTYQIAFDTFRGQEPLETVDATIYARVEEAFMRGNETWLTLAGGQQVSASDVLGVRDPVTADGGG
ncbi:flagellar basal body rod modification protein [Rhodobacterales bacterium HKCCE2091]|nr:flagellar basal body rod modification protein [Rhodobacterales bacterium HKCCE2091]